MTAPEPNAGELFGELSGRIKGLVEDELGRLLSERLEQSYALGPDAVHLVEAVRSLALRGGKRVRAVLVAAAYEALDGEGGAARIAPALAAVELLQAYLLIHDDWMDEDDVRRGGPTVHVMLGEQFGSARAGETTAILAGDWACGLAQTALASTPVPPARLVGAMAELARIQTTVVMGQLLDMRAQALDRAAVERVHDLKTGSYTVRGPLALGAILAGASDDARAQLDAFARPLGIAFQLRDDLLGTFGDARATGKPSGRDLTVGKRTALVAELEAPSDLALRDRVLGVKDAPAALVAHLIERLVASGAKARVEDRLTALLAEARALLAAIPVTSGGRRLLEGAVLALGVRET
ncbi:MAG: Octaprenyl diphosphate synthase [Myxococcaceae bacterium]|nr:Octaprenyl diphosphate synthase [Myxococcaceae bacterium]